MNLDALKGDVMRSPSKRLVVILGKLAKLSCLWNSYPTKEHVMWFYLCTFIHGDELIATMWVEGEKVGNVLIPLEKHFELQWTLDMALNPMNGSSKIQMGWTNHRPIGGGVLPNRFIIVALKSNTSRKLCPKKLQQKSVAVLWSAWSTIANTTKFLNLHPWIEPQNHSNP